MYVSSISITRFFLFAFFTFLLLHKKDDLYVDFLKTSIEIWLFAFMRLNITSPHPAFVYLRILISFIIKISELIKIHNYADFIQKVCWIKQHNIFIHSLSLCNDFRGTMIQLKVHRIFKKKFNDLKCLKKGWVLTKFVIRDGRQLILNQSASHSTMLYLI